MTRRQRCFTLLTLALLGLGPGPFWVPGQAEADSGSGHKQSPSEHAQPTQQVGWMVAPLPQPLLEAKSKPNLQGLFVVALSLATRNPFIAACRPAPAHPVPPPQRRLYLAYARLQTDGP